LHSRAATATVDYVAAAIITVAVAAATAQGEIGCGTLNFGNK